nr:integrase, catalytic region, zinc finger, CCHC-type, peptidase aspartic, catalytic [Tanacetum cinerariifolium]
MLDRTNFASWQQRIRLYCRGKENGVNILKSIDEGPFQMGTVRETLPEGTKGEPHLGLERPRVYSELSPKEKDRYNADIRATNILLQRLPKDIYTLINHYTDAKDIWENVKMLLEGETIHDYYVRFAKLINDTRNIKMTMSRMQLNSKFVNNMLPEWGRFVTADLALNVDNVFQADDCDAFDSDVDEAPTAQTMFKAKLSFADPVYDEVGPSYDLDILSEYVKDNAVPGVHSNVSSVPNDAYMMIYNDMYERHAQSVSKTSRNTVVENSLTVELETYKEQVELYERLAWFELTEREQNINEQLRIVITDRNFKEETLKKNFIL